MYCCQFLCEISKFKKFHGDSERRKLLACGLEVGVSDCNVEPSIMLTFVVLNHSYFVVGLLQTDLVEQFLDYLGKQMLTDPIWRGKITRSSTLKHVSHSTSMNG